jgi:creatinine amidohydrolase
MNHILPTATTSDEKSLDAACAVLPVGSFEQHGDYLPLITDTVIASAISRELAGTYPLFQLPPVTISCSHEHSAWRGTVSISSSTLRAMIDDIYRSITDAGLTSLVILNCHGGNYVLANVVQEGNACGKSMALFPSGRDWADARQSARLATPNHEDIHAGELETSILLHVNPELVRDGYHTADWTVDDRRHLLTTGMREYTQSGVIGRPSLASAEKGKALLASLVESFASVLEILRRPLASFGPQRHAGQEAVNPGRSGERVPDGTGGSAEACSLYRAWHSNSKLGDRIRRSALLYHDHSCLICPTSPPTVRRPCTCGSPTGSSRASSRESSSPARACRPNAT